MERPIEFVGVSSKVSTPKKRKYVSFEVDRWGKSRAYFRRKGRRTAIKAAPGTPEFDREVDLLTKTDPLKLGPARRFSGTYVYFALSGKKVKIGFSKNPPSRLQELRTGNPGRARIYYTTPGDRVLERQLHELFGEDRVNGEWFHFSKVIRDWISADEGRRRKEREV